MPTAPGAVKTPILPTVSGRNLRYNWGFGKQDDITAFRDVFQPDGGYFSPNYPLVPPEQEPVRAWNFPVGYNTVWTPRAYEPVSFWELRALAENHDITRLAIETRKDQIEKLEWQIKPRDDENPSDDAKQRAANAHEFWERPDGEHSFSTWLRIALEDVLVIDAPSFEILRQRDGKIIGLNNVAGDTIKVLTDYNGRRPKYPAPAYEQVIHGRPWKLVSTNDLIYMPRNRRPHKMYGFCYDDETEILTRRGWVKFEALTSRDDVATRNPDTREFEWQRPSHIVDEPYNGPMYHFHSRAVDLMVTPEHRMLVTATPQGLRPRLSRQEITKRDCENRRRRLAGLPNLPCRRANARGENIISAEDLSRTLNPMIKIPMTSVWGGVEIAEKTFALPEPVGTIEVTRRLASGQEQTFVRARHRGNERPVRISGDDYCALVGAYVAEGNLRADDRGIEISQRATSKGFSAYASLTARVLNGPAQHDGRAFQIPRTGLTEHFKQFGLAHEKFVPEEIMGATPRQIQIFLDHYMLGDGHREAGGSWRATTVSRRLADQLVELAQKIGLSASVRTNPAHRAKICGHESNCREAYIVSFRRSPAMGVKTSRVEYSGRIHCVTVPNGIVYVRRNGKPAWSSNSPVEQIITTVNIGMRRQIMQLQHFTDGNVPPGLINGPEGWSPEQLSNYQAWFDSILAGNTANRTKVWWGPFGSKYTPFHESPYKDDFDEWLARVVCFAFSLPPTAFTKTQNRGEQEATKEAALEEGLAPLMGWVKRLVDYVIQVLMGQHDLEFSWKEDVREISPIEQAQISQIFVKEGVKTRNEARDDLGLDPIEGMDELMADTAQGPVLLRNIADQHDMQMQQQQLAIDGQKQSQDQDAELHQRTMSQPQEPEGGKAESGATKAARRLAQAEAQWRIEIDRASGRRSDIGKAA